MDRKQLRKLIFVSALVVTGIAMMLALFHNDAGEVVTVVAAFTVGVFAGLAWPQSDIAPREVKP